MEITNVNYSALPGLVLIDPIEHEIVSKQFANVNPAAKAYMGRVIAVGPAKLTDAGTFIEAPVKVGDEVLYSIAGVEKAKLPYGDDLNHELVIAPFGRILLVKHE